MSSEELRVDVEAVWSSVSREVDAHSSAFASYRRAVTEVEEVVAGWTGIGSSAFNQGWTATSRNLNTTLDNWSTLNEASNRSLVSYRDEESSNSELLDYGKSPRLNL